MNPFDNSAFRYSAPSPLSCSHGMNRDLTLPNASVNSTCRAVPVSWVSRHRDTARRAALTLRHDPLTVSPIVTFQRHNPDSLTWNRSAPRAGAGAFGPASSSSGVSGASVLVLRLGVLVALVVAGFWVSLPVILVRLARGAGPVSAVLAGAASVASGSCGPGSSSHQGGTSSAGALSSAPRVSASIGSPAAPPVGAAPASAGACTAAWTSAATASRPNAVPMSLKSEPPSGSASGKHTRAGPVLVFATRAAAAAALRPGLPLPFASVSRSSSPQTRNSAAGCRSRSAWAMCRRLPASKQTATGRPVASWSVAPVA